MGNDHQTKFFAWQFHIDGTYSNTIHDIYLFLDGQDVLAFIMYTTEASSEGTCSIWGHLLYAEAKASSFFRFFTTLGAAHWNPCHIKPAQEIFKRVHYKYVDLHNWKTDDTIEFYPNIRKIIATKHSPSTETTFNATNSMINMYWN